MRIAASRIVMNDPTRFTSITALNCSVVMARLTLPVSLSVLIIRPSLMIPAAETQMLSAPKRSMARSIRSATCSSFVTLTFIDAAAPPAAVISPTTRSRLRASMSPITTLTPFAAIDFATDSPMPLAPPVMTATAPLSSI